MHSSSNLLLLALGNRSNLKIGTSVFLRLFNQLVFFSTEGIDFVSHEWTSNTHPGLTFLFLT